MARTLLISFEETGAVETLNEALEVVEGLPEAAVASVRCNLLRTRFRFTGNAEPPAVLTEKLTIIHMSRFAC